MIIAGLCDSYLLECLDGIHRATDGYALALYTASANLGPKSKAYTTLGEVYAMGYEPGGALLSGRITGLTAGAAWLNFANQTWSGTIMARGGLIYNRSRENRAVVVIDFGEDIKSTNHEFLARFPQDGAEAAVIISRG